MGIPVIIGVFMGIMWSSFSDAIGRRKPFLIQSSILMALFTFAITLISSFEGFLILGFFRALFIPMAEGLIVTSLFRLSDYRESHSLFRFRDMGIRWMGHRDRARRCCGLGFWDKGGFLFSKLVVRRRDNRFSSSSRT